MQKVFFHACHNGAVHAFRDWLNDRVATHLNVTKRVCYELASDMDRIGVDYDATGRGEPPEWLDDELVRTADFYMCGPAPFMATHKRALIDAGVVPERVHTEVFGPGTV